MKRLGNRRTGLPLSNESWDHQERRQDWGEWENGVMIEFQRRWRESSNMRYG